MSIDLNKLREKHKAIAEKKNNNNGEFLNNFVQLAEGTNVVRILPSKDGDSFYTETKIHRITVDGDNKNLHCRAVHGEPCPLCDLYKNLWNMHNNKVGRKSKERTPFANLASKIKPGERYYMNVLVRPANDIKILSVGKQLFEVIVGSMLGDPDKGDDGLGDVTDLKSGRDFKIFKKTETSDQGTFPKYNGSQFLPNQKPAGTPAEVAKYMDSLHDIKTFIKLEDYDEMKALADSLLAGLGVATNASRPTITTEKSSDKGDDDSYLDKLRG